MSGSAIFGEQSKPTIIMSLLFWQMVVYALIESKMIDNAYGNWNIILELWFRTGQR